MFEAEPLNVQQAPDDASSAKTVASTERSASLATVAARGALKSPPMAQGMAESVAKAHVSLRAAACWPWAPPHGP